MKRIVYDNFFQRQLKRLLKKHYNITELQIVLDLLTREEPLPAKYHDHALSGDYKMCRDCHIRPDWLLIYRVTETEIILLSTGSHDELFK